MLHHRRHQCMRLTAWVDFITVVATVVDPVTKLRAPIQALPVVAFKHAL